MIATNIGGASAFGSAARPEASTTADIEAGTVHLAVPYTSRWKVSANGESIAARPAFGLTNAYDIPTKSRVTLSFHTSMVHSLLVLIQFAAWCVVVFVAFSRRRQFIRRGRTITSAPTNIDPAITMHGGQS
jgi:hypothetical protein